MLLFTPVSAADALALEAGDRVAGPLFWQTELVEDEADAGAVWVMADVDEATVALFERLEDRHPDYRVYLLPSDLAARLSVTRAEFGG